MRGRSFHNDIRGKLLGAVALALCILTCSSLPAVAQVADPAVNAAIKKLSDKREDCGVRESAARTLGHLSPPTEAAVRALTDVLQDKNEKCQVQRAAVNALEGMAPETGEAGHAVSALVKTLANRHSVEDPIRAAAARALGKILQRDQKGQVTAQAVPVLVDTLKKPDPDPMVRANAAWALGQIIQEGNNKRSADSLETRIVTALIQGVKVTHRNVAETSAQSLIRYKAAVPQLIAELKDDELKDRDPNFTWDVTWMLAQIGKDAKDAVPSLTHLLDDNREDPNVRGCAAWALGMIGPDAKAGTSNFQHTVSVLTDALRNSDNDPNVRSNAAFALGKIGPDVKAGTPNLQHTVPVLTDALRNSDNDPSVRSNAAWALGQMGPQVKPDKARFPDAVAAALSNALSDTDPDVRRNAAWALGKIGPVPQTAVSALVTKLKDVDKDPMVRKETAEALGALGKIHSLGGGAETTVQALSGALKDGDQAVRMAAAVAIGLIGADARTAIKQLLNASGPKHAKNEEPDRKAAAEALAKIANSLQKKETTEAINELEEAEGGLKENGHRDDAEQIRDAVHDLRNSRNSLLFNRIMGPLEWKPRYRVLALVICVYMLVWLLLYWQFPLLAFRVNEALKPYAGHKLPKFLGGLPVSYLILGGIFHYRPRVLDAWVAEYIGSARKKFEKKLTVEQREVYVELPVFFNGKGVSALRATDVRSCFQRKRTCVLICGEGGAGKTSLACQICKWAMADDRRTRLSQHPILAVLLDQENLEANDTLVEAVRRELRYLIDLADAPSAELVEKLLESRRVLVVVDGFSEMNEATRTKIQPGKPQFAARALVITSRLDENPAGVDLDTVKPMRVHGDHLSTFMDAYLVQRNKKELFSDSEYFDDLGKLSRMVGERDVTVLLARLYAEQMIAAKEAPLRYNLPENIPDLMLEYLNELNKKVMQSRLDDRVVHQAAKTIAWECLKETCRPMPARIDRVLQRLDGQTGAIEERLKYLEGSLRVVQTIGAGRDRIRFTLDPLAEYLAGLQVMEDLAKNEQDWRKFLADTDAVPGAPEAIKGFLLSICDCCLAKGTDVGVPDFVLAELGKRAGSDPRGDKKRAQKPANKAFLVQSA